jgi:hypothetical protein
MPLDKASGVVHIAGAERPVGALERVRYDHICQKYREEALALLRSGTWVAFGRWLSGPELTRISQTPWRRKDTRLAPVVDGAVRFNEVCWREGGFDQLTVVAAIEPSPQVPPAGQGYCPAKAVPGAMGAVSAVVAGRITGNQERRREAIGYGDPVR